MAAVTPSSKSDESSAAQENGAIPPLENGDRLTRIEFERRYVAMPGLKKAELVEGEVYMPSPVRYGQHSHPHTRLVTWLGNYETDTPGVEAGDNGSIRLGVDWQLGGAIPGTTNDFGKNAGYGTLIHPRYLVFGGHGATVRKFNDFRNVLAVNPCPAGARMERRSGRRARAF